MRWGIVPVAAVLAATAGAGAAWFLPERGGADPYDRQQVASGARVYAENCAACHGADLEGQLDWKTRNAEGRLPAPPHDDSGHTWHHPDDILFGITKHGIANYAPKGYESDMPAFGDTLSDAEIWAVLAYVKTYWSAPNLARQQGLSEQSGN